MEALFITICRHLKSLGPRSIICKGQTKSKWFSQADISSKKTDEQILLYYYETSGWLFSFVFWKKLKTPKRHFEINWLYQQTLNTKESLIFFLKPRNIWYFIYSIQLNKMQFDCIYVSTFLCTFWPHNLKLHWSFCF